MRTDRKNAWWRQIMAAAIMASCAMPALAEEDNAAELAKKLANPIASLISVPLQYNYDEYGGRNDGAAVSRLNIQPVIPCSLSGEWNIITRTIVPLVDQQDFSLAAMNESGLGDITASQFFSPKAPNARGWIWGVGPVELLPAATDKTLGGEKWGLGPTAVALKQSGPWTVGILTNHIWSVAGDDERDDINATYLQPFVSYITTTKTTFGLNTESTYDWKGEQWSVPVIAQVAQMFKIGPQILQLAVGAKYWAQLTFVFPK